MVKVNKIKGGIYCGWWRDFYPSNFAKRYGHKQNRARGRKECREAAKAA